MTTAVADRDSSTGADHPGEEELSHAQILEVMTGLLAALFTALISTTIVSTALPTIMADLNGTQRQYTWVITAALLAMTITTPIMGKLADLFDKKILVQFSIVLFVAGSIGAGFSQEIWQLMVFRAAQGIGMGGLTSLTQAIMGTVIAPRQRGRYAGYMGAVMAVATVSGPLLGGVITDNLNWRWCFFVCIPLAVIALILLQKTLKLPTQPARRVRLDGFGALFLAIAAAAPMLWVTFAGKDYEWISWESAGFLAAFLAAAGVAIAIELRHSEPIVPIRVLRNSTTALMIIAGVGVGVAMFGMGTFLTQFFQLAGGHSPTRAGLMTIPMIISQLLSSVICGQLVTRTGRWKPIMVVGTVLLLVGLGGMSFIDHTTPYWQVAISMAVAGVGVGALIQNIVLAVQNTVDVKDIGASSATIAFFRSLGGAVGVSILGAVLADQVQDKVADGLRGLGGGAAAGGLGGGSGAGNLDIGSLPAPVQEIVRNAYGDTFGTIFLIAGIVAIVAFVAVIAVREVPLRTTVAMSKPAESGSDVAAADNPEGPKAPAPAAAPTRVLNSPAGSATAQLTATNGSPAGDGSPADAPAQPAGAGSHRPAESQLSAEIDWDPRDLDAPAERASVAALDVLAAAQDRARTREADGEAKIEELLGRVDTLSHEVDAAVGSFHRQLQELRSQLTSGTSSAAAPRPDGVGGDQLRQYEYNLLLDSQQAADRVTTVAREEAERMLTEAGRRQEEMESRIEQLRQVERELADRVQQQLARPGAGDPADASAEIGLNGHRGAGDDRAE